MNQKARIFAITGGCGFIGAHLAYALVNRGDRVRILDDLTTGRRDAAPREADLLIGDVADPEAVADVVIGADGVFHLAAVASVERCNNDWRQANRTNLGGTVTVFEGARDAGTIPVSWASSAAIYGPASGMPISEDTAKAPLSPYGADKLGGELHATAAAAIFDLPTTALRFFNVFGAGQDPASPYSGVISIFADRLSRGQPITIHGDGEQSRDFIYVGDVVAAMIASMDRMLAAKQAGEAARSDAINVCSGKAVTVNTLARTLERLLGVKGTITHATARAGDIRHSTGDPSRMHALLGIEARTDLDSGLRALLDDARLREAV